MRGWVGLLRRSPTFLGEQKPKSNLGPPSCGTGMTLTSFCKKITMFRSPKKDAGNLWGSVVRKAKTKVRGI